MDYHQNIWLESYPKSGNTWVRMFLDAYFLGEVDINDVVTSVTDDSSPRHQVGDGSKVETFPIAVQQLTRPMALLRLVRQFEANRFADIPLFVKTHNQHVIANGIELLPMELTKAVVHIVRDPREVLPSFSTHMGKSQEEGLERMEDKLNVIFQEGMAAVADFVGSWNDHTKAYLNNDTHNVRTWRYEDMKADPVRVFSEILEHSGVTPSKARVKEALEKVKLDRLKKQEEKKGFSESSPYAENQFFGKKHQRITPKLKHRIEKKCGRIMKRLNYD